MRRAGGGGRRRRAAAAPRDRADRRGRDRAQEVRDRLHQRAAAREEDGPVQAEQVVLLVGASGWRSREEHDISVCQDGVYDRAVAAIAEAKRRGFRTIINATLFDNAEPEKVGGVLRRRDGDGGGRDLRSRPAMRMSGRRTSSISSTGRKTKELFRGIFARAGQGAWKRKWAFNQSSMFLDFLAGNQTFHCTPWGNPTRTYFGWQRPCYLLGEGYAKTFKELMEDDRLGSLRHRQLREMRRLHGAFRLRGDRGDRDDPPAVAGRGTGGARHSHRGRDGAGDPAGEAAAGGIRVQPARGEGGDARSARGKTRAGCRRGGLRGRAAA